MPCFWAFGLSELYFASLDLRFLRRKIFLGKAITGLTNPAILASRKFFQGGRRDGNVGESKGANCCRSPDVEDLGSNPSSATLQLRDSGHVIQPLCACVLVSMELMIAVTF